MSKNATAALLALLILAASAGIATWLTWLMLYPRWSPFQCGLHF